jgi:hypothetical protein
MKDKLASVCTDEEGARTRREGKVDVCEGGRGAGSVGRVGVGERGDGNHIHVGRGREISHTHCLSLSFSSPIIPVAPYLPLCNSPLSSSPDRTTTASRPVHSRLPAHASQMRTVSFSTGTSPLHTFPISLDSLSSRTCNECTQTTCAPKSGTSKTNGGVSKGALAGGVVAAVILLALAVSLYLWYRRSSRIRRILSKNRDAPKDKPASAADVLNRPDPTEKLPVPSSQQPPLPAVAEHVDPESHITTLPPLPRPQFINPFDDSNSIQTTRTEGPNVIPIALVASPDNRRSGTDTDTLPSSASSGPVRPPRSPDLNLNLEHVNMSHDNIRFPYAASSISGISNRNSFMSGASYSSDFLNEAPVIVTANKGPVRQVLNVVKAEVVNTGNISPTSDGGLKPPSYHSRPVITSPLASTSFGPSDVLREVDEHEAHNPFEDTQSTQTRRNTSSTTRSSDLTSSQSQTTDSDWTPDGPSLPWKTRSGDSRPSSIQTSSSIANIGSATRVKVGLSSPSSPASPAVSPRAPHRTTMGRLVSPMSDESTQSGVLQEQQARAYLQAQGSRRISGSSVVSATSTRADSILEAFPFVPPSPISDRPIRSPPVSPLGTQSYTASQVSHSPQPLVTVAPASPMSQRSFTRNNGSTQQTDEESLPAPPNRQALGMSTGSQLSTTSTGLGSFPFQIDAGATAEANNSLRPSSANNRQRASLDTLALTSDLASYPLDFDHESMPPPLSARRP